MKQEHEMYSNNMELILSIHFLTGEKGNKMVAIIAELKHIAISHPLTKWPFSVLSLQLLYKLC